MNYKEYRQKRADRYKQLRKLSGWNLEAIAEKYGVSTSTLSRFENNKITNDKALLVYRDLLGEVD